MFPLAQKYRATIEQMMANSKHQSVITEENVLQQGNVVNRKLFYKIVEDLMLPGSKIEGIENLIDLYHKSQAGKACLILMEHYSNFDLPCLFNLLEKGHSEGAQTADSLIAMAGLKLNEESPVVMAFAEAFSRIIIYPSRSIEALPDSPEKEAELKRAQRINMAAMKALFQSKKNGKIILVFPAGTRYRPGKPETKKGVKEIDSYMKGFDHMVLISINGNALEVTSGGMETEQGKPDVIVYGVSPVIDCSEYRKQAQSCCTDDQDSKQFTVDQVMADLDKLHDKHEPLRQKLLKKV